MKKLYAFPLIFLFLWQPNTPYVQQLSCLGSEQVKGACFEASGRFRVWNGWPPNLRMEAEDHSHFYGVSEWGYIPDNMTEYLPADIVGTFLLCPLGYDNTVPYDTRPITAVCVEAIIEAYYEDFEDGEMVRGKIPVPHRPKK